MAYHVYILASAHRTLYIGITGNLDLRVAAHQYKVHPFSFAVRYNCDRLVYFEEFVYVQDAIAREKQVKSWRRSKKVALIEAVNPDWVNLMPFQ